MTEPADAVMVAAVQVDSLTDEEANWTQSERLIREAAACAAEVIALPENMLYEGKELKRRQDVEGVWIPRFQELARELGVAFVTGSLREPAVGPGIVDDGESSFNTIVAIDREGNIHGRYRKMHLFDIDLPDGTYHKESSYLTPGDAPVTCELPPLGRIGLSVCYDLRFPELYRKLFMDGAETLFVPSSFTMETGRDHWEVLVRARAIENQAFVVAPNQWGQKGRVMRKYGRSMIVDPWGVVLARCPDRPSFCIARLDFAALRETRRNLPTRDHVRLL